MESEHTENGRDIKARPIDEKETVCNRVAADAVFRESIVILKIGGSHGNGGWKHSCVCRDVRACEKISVITDLL